MNKDNHTFETPEKNSINNIQSPYNNISQSENLNFLSKSSTDINKR